MKQRMPRKPRKGAYIVYSWQKAQSAYLSPVQMLNEALNLVNWKNVEGAELKAFRDRVREKLAEVIQRKSERKRKTKAGKKPRDECYMAFQKWRRKHGVEYSKQFFNEVWKPCYAAGVEPEQEQQIHHN